MKKSKSPEIKTFTEAEKKGKKKLPEHRGRTVEAVDINRKLLRLLTKYPYLLQTQVDALCGNSEVNFIKTLLVELHEDRFRRYFRKKLGFCPEYVSEPYRIIRQVQFHIVREHQRNTFIAKRVLAKKAFGSYAGLVISDDYPGLILDFHGLPQDGAHELKMPTANRIWASNDITDNGNPYSLWLTETEMERVQTTFSDLLRTTTNEFPTNIFFKHIGEHPELTTNFEHLLFLLEEVGIDFPEEQIACSVEK